MASRCRRAYILPLMFFLSSFSFFFRCLISEVTERISTKLGCIYTYDCYLKNLVRIPPGIYLLRAGRQKRFFATDFELWKQHISATKHDINNRKETCQSTGNPYIPPNLVTLVHKRLITVGEFFCPPPKFSHWETLPALPHGRHTTNIRQPLASVM